MLQMADCRGHCDSILPADLIEPLSRVSVRKSLKQKRIAECWPSLELASLTVRPSELDLLSSPLFELANLESHFLPGAENSVSSFFIIFAI